MFLNSKFSLYIIENTCHLSLLKASSDCKKSQSKLNHMSITQEVISRFSSTNITSILYIAARQ